ncbi:glutathione S-transferase N-terminal domain-containing protein [Rhizobium sp. 2YAF20]|uniref:glutathione S-transferase N-terminal domain-containing protein n=1 Tax=Rhizobium sp. 2YAF20 TaxID=3233027 RepID=UPI003F9AA2DC
MKLYYSPLACSLADHIALQESGAPYEREQVDLKTKRIMSGGDFNEITPKGYVPALVLDNGETLTENIAILDWLASQFPKLGGSGPLGRTRVLEALTYISTELHGGFKPMWHAGSDAEKAAAKAALTFRFKLLSDRLTTKYLLGDEPTVADFYLFVTLLWAERFGVEIPPRLAELRARMKTRPAVQLAMQQEGLAA